AFPNSLTIGSPGTMQNSQCILDAGASSNSGSGDSWTPKIALSFKSAFVGSYSTYMFVGNGTIDTGWVNRGSSWTVAVPTVITAASVTPSSGSTVAGATQTFTHVYTDSAGAGDITEFWTFLRPNYASNPTDHACYVHWTKSDNQVY